jgi:hypothetical protein
MILSFETGRGTVGVPALFLAIFAFCLTKRKAVLRI